MSRTRCGFFSLAFEVRRPAVSSTDVPRPLERHTNRLSDPAARLDTAENRLGGVVSRLDEALDLLRNQRG